MLDPSKNGPSRPLQYLGVKLFITHIIRIYVSRFKAPAHEWNCYNTARLKLEYPVLNFELNMPKTHIAAKKCIIILSFNAPWQKSFILIHDAVMFMHVCLFHFMFFRAYLFAFISTQFQNIVCVLYRSVCCFIDLIWCLQTLGNPGTSLQICQCQHYRVEQIVVITVQVLFGKPEIDSARFQPHLVSPFDLPSSAVLYKMTCKSQSRSRSHIFFANGWTDHFCLKKTRLVLQSSLIMQNADF